MYTYTYGKELLHHPKIVDYPEQPLPGQYPALSCLLYACSISITGKQDAGVASFEEQDKSPECDETQR